MTLSQTEVKQIVGKRKNKSDTYVPARWSRTVESMVFTLFGPHTRRASHKRCRCILTFLYPSNKSLIEFSWTHEFNVQHQTNQCWKCYVVYVLYFYTEFNVTMWSLSFLRFSFNHVTVTRFEQRNKLLLWTHCCKLIALIANTKIRRVKKTRYLLK